jgi:hypothetical protein
MAVTYKEAAMDTSGTHSPPSLLDVSRMSLAQLRNLDDRIIDDMLGVFLQTCADTGTRRWDDGSGPPRQTPAQS